MNDVDFEKVRSLFESDDKECLLVFCGEYFKQIISMDAENCLGRNYDVLISRRLFQEIYKRCMAIR